MAAISSICQLFKSGDEFIFTNKNLTNVVVGFCNYDQYRSFVEIKKNLKENINYDLDFDNFDETILNPNHWQLL